MTRQVKGQRDALIAANEETERRRRLFDSVLSGVTAGVIGLDGAGRIEMMNAAAATLLDLDPSAAAGRALRRGGAGVRRPPAPARRPQGAASPRPRCGCAARARERDLLVRVAARHADDGHLEGYVVSFDDVTDLVVAQRMAAWGDVARRIAHEVKNPLTPIQLSAERLRRKFGPMVGDERAALEQYADVIVRQTNDLRRIVDEFSKFARMPAPERRPLDLGKLITEAVRAAGIRAARTSATTLSLPEHAVLAHLDGTMINQALHQPPEERRRGDRGPAGAGDAEPPGEIRVRAGGRRPRASSSTSRTTAPACPTSRRGCSSPTSPTAPRAPGSACRSSRRSSRSTTARSS